MRKHKLLILCLFLLIRTSSNAQKVGDFINFKMNGEVPFGKINCLAIDAYNTKWLGTDNGLLSFAGDTASKSSDWKWYNRFETSDSLFRKIEDIAIDKNGHKWIATNQSDPSIVELDRKGDFVRIYRIPKTQGFSNRINGIAVDETGRKWVATEETGVWMLDMNLDWVNYRTEDGIMELRSNSIKSIKVDVRNTVWIGTNKGLCSLDDEGQWSFYDVRDFVSSIAADVDQHVCLSLIDKKGRQHLYCNNEDFKDVEQSSRKDSFTFVDVIIDQDGVVWMAGNGLAKHEAGTRTVYTSANSKFQSQQANCLQLDESGNLWIGTNESGLYKYILKEKGQLIKLEPVRPLLAHFNYQWKSGKMKPQALPMYSIAYQKEFEEELVIELEKVPNRLVYQFLSSTKMDNSKRKLKQLPMYDAIFAQLNTHELMDEEDIVAGAMIELEDLMFKPRSAELSNMIGVNELIKFMQRYPKVKIELAGHTDMNPPKTDPRYAELSQYFMDLSRKRVEAVSQLLVKAGIAAERIVTKAYGGTMPLDKASYDSPVNRRVEMKILKVD
jgi:outer membrane protein OmpA-like peptidoglycan-associated protein